ncbi:MAG: tRNA pseudouridine(55) synthase TruB [Candidatus Kryptoniota bacterium]
MSEEGRVIPVYKPKGMTSFAALRRVRNLLGIKKIGHAGTLDPLAEGLLILLTERKTRLMEEFLKLEKEYVAELQFGISSPSHDLETNPVTVAENLTLTEDNLRQTLAEFVGEIDQIPPSFSATWVNGKRSYELARKGKYVTLKPKKVLIKQIELLSFELPYARLRIVCSSGTYIRSLVRDIGNRLGIGAVLVDLVRTRIGTYTLEDAKRIEEIKQVAAA